MAHSGQSAGVHHSERPASRGSTGAAAEPGPTPLSVHAGSGERLADVQRLLHHGGRPESNWQQRPIEVVEAPEPAARPRVSREPRRRGHGSKDVAGS
jgi:hypothetical protein